MSDDQVDQVWIDAAGVDELDDGDVKRVETVPPVALYRVGDEFFATADTCTHMEFALSDGYLDEDRIECALHMAEFDIRTGKALSLPATRSLDTYPVEVVGERVRIDVGTKALVPRALVVAGEG